MFSDKKIVKISLSHSLSADSYIIIIINLLFLGFKLSDSAYKLTEMEKVYEDKHNFIFKLVKIFTKADTDKDGIIKWEQFPDMMRKLCDNQHLIFVSNETLFKKYDSRNDGRLTVDEWIKLGHAVTNNLINQKHRFKIIYDNSTINQLQKSNRDLMTKLRILENENKTLKKNLKKLD